MTDAEPTLEEIGDVARQIAAIRQEAKDRVADLIERRDRYIVTYTAQHPRSLTAAARAAKISRQRADAIVRAERRADEIAANRDQ